MRIRIISLIVISFLIFSCGNGEPSTSTVFVVKNSSLHDVSLTIFNLEIESFPDTDSTFNILPNSDIRVSYGDGLIGSSLYPYPFGIASDSANVVFDKTLMIIYRKDDLTTDRNIFNIDNYTEEVNVVGNSDIYTYTYVITAEDYERAVPIENN